MRRVALPHDAAAGPTKPEVRAVALSKLRLEPSDHLVDVGACTGAVTIEAARRAGRVTAIERDRDRAETARNNLAVNDVATDVEVRRATTSAARRYQTRHGTGGRLPTTNCRGPTRSGLRAGGLKQL